jgi:hypothetical protein
MDVLKEQRVCIKFCQKFGKTATETNEMLQQAFGETALSHNGRRRRHLTSADDREASPVKCQDNADRFL